MDTNTINSNNYYENTNKKNLNIYKNLVNKDLINKDLVNKKYEKKEFNNMSETEIEYWRNLIKEKINFDNTNVNIMLAYRTEYYSILWKKLNIKY